MRRRILLKLVGSSALVGATCVVSAQSARPVLRVVVPYTAGGQSDILARLMAFSMQRTLDRPVIVDNKPGAAALIAIRLVLASPADGDTLLFHNSGMIALPMLQKGVNYDAQRDFAPVAMTGLAPPFVMIHESVPARTVPEFLAYAKANPMKIECANAGINGPGHIAALLLEKMTGIKLLHVPYKGSSESASAIISGQVKMQIAVTTDYLNSQIEIGKIRMLGVLTNERTSLAPTVPPMKDFVPGYAMDGWSGFLAPARTPIAKREALAQAVKVALEDRTVKEGFSKLFVEAIYREPKEFVEVINGSVRNWRNIVDTLQLVPS